MPAQMRIEYADVSCFLGDNRKHLSDGQLWLPLPAAPSEEELPDVELWFVAERASVVVRGVVLAVTPEPDANGRYLTGIELAAAEKNRLVRKIQKMLQGSIQPDSRRIPLRLAGDEPPPRSKRAAAVQLASPIGQPAEAVVEPDPDQDADAHVEGEKLTVTEFAQLPMAAQARLALRGNHAARQMVIRKKSIPLMRFLLENPSLTESEVVSIAGMREMTHEILQRIADDKDWRACDGIRVALLENVSTPVPLALRLVPLINRRDLRRMYKRRTLRAPIEQAIRRLLEPTGTPS